MTRKPQVVCLNVPVGVQVVVLSEVAKRLGWREGDKLVIFIEDNKLSIMRVDEFYAKYGRNFEMLSVEKPRELPREIDLKHALKLVILWE